MYASTHPPLSSCEGRPRGARMRPKTAGPKDLAVEAQDVVRGSAIGAADRNTHAGGGEDTGSHVGRPLRGIGAEPRASEQSRTRAR